MVGNFLSSFSTRPNTRSAGKKTAALHRECKFNSVPFWISFQQKMHKSTCQTKLFLFCEPQTSLNRKVKCTLDTSSDNFRRSRWCKTADETSMEPVPPWSSVHMSDQNYKYYNRPTIYNIFSKNFGRTIVNFGFFYIYRICAFSLT